MTDTMWFVLCYVAVKMAIAFAIFVTLAVLVLGAAIFLETKRVSAELERIFARREERRLRAKADDELNMARRAVRNWGGE